MGNEVLDLLKAVRGLLSDPAAWTQGAHARDAAGNEVPYNSDKATCYCLAGAVMRALPDPPGPPYDYAKEHVKAVIRSGARGAMVHVAESLHKRSYLSTVDVNDTPGRTHAEILAVLDAAILQETGK